MEKMKEALSVIAEVTNSDRIRKFLETGVDRTFAVTSSSSPISHAFTAGDASQVSSPEMPRGLNQLGNTCYLNSLLQVCFLVSCSTVCSRVIILRQYFYTIKDLRDAVRPMSHLDLKSIEEDKVSDEDINKHRVGGRRVTRREIIRSKKCKQLSL